MKFLLLGGGGYLGTVLSKLIVDRNQEAIVYDKFEYSNPEDLVCPYIKDDITNITSHLDKLSNVDCVLYMASLWACATSTSCWSLIIVRSCALIDASSSSS